MGGDSGRSIVGGRFHDWIPLSQIPVLCASLNVLSPSCTIENRWRAVRQPARSIRGNRTKFNGVGQCVRSPEARRREAMKTATPLEQRGAIAITLYGFAVVAVTSYFRPRLGYRRWKKLHYTAYVAAATMFVHGTLIDPELKNRPTDFLDGEKLQLLVEGCHCLVITGVVWRIRRGTEKQRYRASNEVMSEEGGG